MKLNKKLYQLRYAMAVYPLFRKEVDLMNAQLNNNPASTSTANSNDNSFGWNLDNSYLQLPKVFYSTQKPTPVAEPALVVLNDALAKALGLDPEALKTQAGAALLAGNRNPPGGSPLAQAYAGHQFGHFTMLGDGRAVLLGEQITPAGDRFDIQLKGAGQTPYSRRGDGRAALGPMLREYIISEAMHALGIPTTRSLAVVTTGEPVFRETRLQGAILARVAASHLRVGTFEYTASRLTAEDLKALADYTIQRHYPESAEAENPYLELLKTVIEGQASLIARWQLVGFIHGVMNTDNMALSGETIDYGPCAFMNTYNPNTVFSSIDHQGRYAYGNQPSIGGWNLSRFAEALLPLIHPEQEQAVKVAQEVLNTYSERFQHHWLQGMRKKLGILDESTVESSSSSRSAHDNALVNGLLNLMEQHKLDYTNTFLALIRALEGNDKPKETIYIDPSIEADPDNMPDAIINHPALKEWMVHWRERLEGQPQSLEDSLDLMHRSNPAVIPRNHLVETALKAAEEDQDLSPFHRLITVLADPYSHTTEKAAYAAPPKPGRPYRTFCGT